MLTFFSKLYLKMLGRYFTKRPLAKLATVTLFTIVLGLVAFGIYRFFYRGFLFIAEQPFFEAAISLYMYELFLLIVMVMVWIGAVIAQLFTLFKRKENIWALVAPKYLLVPIASMLKAIVSTSWLLIIVIVPALIASTQVHSVPIWLSLLAVLATVVFSASLVGVALFITIFIARVLGLIHRKLVSFGVIMLAHVAILIGMLMTISWRFTNSDLFRILYVDNFDIKKAPIDLVTGMFKWFPTHELAKTYLAAYLGDVSMLLNSLFFLFASFAVIVFLVLIALRLWFLPVWQALSENSHASLIPRGRRLGNLSLLKSNSGAVIYNELISLVRNSRSLFWLLFIGLLWLGHIGSEAYLQRITRRYELAIPAIPALALALPIAILSYFVAALVLRFAFPSFSSERKTAWIFMVSPIKRGKIVWLKFIFYGIAFSFVAIIAQALAANVMRNTEPYMWVYALLAVIISVFLTAVGISLGASFPNFDTDDPEVLSTSMAGLLSVFISVAYGAVATLVMFRYVTFKNPNELIIFGVVSFLLALIFVHIASRKTNKVEFISHKS